MAPQQVEVKLKLKLKVQPALFDDRLRWPPTTTAEWAQTCFRLCVGPGYSADVSASLADASAHLNVSFGGVLPHPLNQSAAV
jgi:hypothetical protein